jgi:hypothetical protein
MTKGLKKRVIILSLCLTTLYLLPTDTYAQDEPATDPGYIEQPIGQDQPSDQQSDGNAEDKIFKDDVIHNTDSTGYFNTSGIDFRKHKGGGGIYGASGGGGPYDPPPDPDASVPLDNGVLLLIAIGIAYGFRRAYLYRKSLAIA